MHLLRPVPLLIRERSPTAAHADRRDIDIGERDIRVDDYVNDKLQTDSDFANLDTLIASVETQRIQLQDQVGLCSYWSAIIICVQPELVLLPHG